MTILRQLGLTHIKHISCSRATNLASLVSSDIEPSLGAALVGSTQVVLARTAQHDRDAGFGGIALQAQLAYPAVLLGLVQIESDLCSVPALRIGLGRAPARLAERAGGTAGGMPGPVLRVFGYAEAAVGGVPVGPTLYILRWHFE